MTNNINSAAATAYKNGASLLNEQLTDLNIFLSDFSGSSNKAPEKSKKQGFFDRIFKK